jgi:1-acyl-sn-glycerol-3-phosphate acyltransferase
MGINKVDQKSIGYNILWYSIKLWHHVFYYQNIEIAHKELVPKKGTLIFTPNHQNALMDALAVLFGTKRKLVFLARADIFSKKFFAEILYFLRILPVFRPRDGQGEVKRNVETFSKTSEVLRKNLSLVLFPEGTHSEKQSLMPLKKGFVKIALQSEEANDFKLGIQLMPMAISYSNYEQCQSKLSINYGHPIDLQPYYESYKEHPAVAFNAVRNALEEELKKIMIHIDDNEFYKTNEFLMMAFAKKVLRKHNELQHHRIVDGRNFLDKLKAWQVENPAQFVQIHQNTQQFLSLSKKLKSRQRIVFANFSFAEFILNGLLLLIFSPIILPAATIHFPNYYLSNLPSQFIKDKQFVSSVRFVVGFLVVPLVFLMEWGIFSVVFHAYDFFQFSLIYIFALLLSTITLSWLRKTSAMTKVFWMSVFHKTDFNKMKSAITEIQKIIRTI